MSCREAGGGGVVHCARAQSPFHILHTGHKLAWTIRKLYEIYEVHAADSHG